MALIFDVLDIAEEGASNFYYFDFGFEIGLTISNVLLLVDFVF